MPQFQPFSYCPHCGTPLTIRQTAGIPRPACPNCHFIHFPDSKVAVGVLLIHNEQILLVKRGMEPELGKWSMPAGFVDAGIHPQAVAMREVAEETGLQIEITHLLDVLFNPPDGKAGADIFILYEGKLIAGIVRPGDDAQEARFFPPDQLPPLANFIAHDLLENWVERDGP